MKLALSRKNAWDLVGPSLKTALSPILDAIPQEYLLGWRFRQHLRFLEDAQWWSADRSHAYQLQQLRRICAVAHQRAPYYQRIFSSIGFTPQDLAAIEDFRRLPTTTRDTLRDHLADMETVSTRHPTVDYASTAGTSGMPLRFYIGSDRSHMEYAYLVSSWQRVGYRLGIPLAVLRGRAVPARRDGIHHHYDPVFRSHFYSTFHMTDANMTKYLAHIGKLGPCFLHVYPSSIATLAAFLRRSQSTPPVNIQGVIAESENVYPEQRRMVEETFRCRYFSCYGLTEKVVAAAECEKSPNYHVWPTYGLFELLDDNGRPVTTPGQRGEIVGTGFINTVVPFIRYRTGDHATYVADHCADCGRAHPIITDIRGHRTQETLVAADGSLIPWAALNMHDDTFDCVVRFQFYQDTPGHAVLRLIPAPDFTEDDRRRILTNLSRKIDQRLQLTVHCTAAIPLAARAKAIYVDQRIRGRTADNQETS